MSDKDHERGTGGFRQRSSRIRRYGAPPGKTKMFSGSTLPGRERFLRLPEVMRRVGLSRSTIYASIRAESFPKPIRLGPNAVGWLEDDIDAWMDARIRDARR